MFNLTEEQDKKLSKWIEEQDAKVAAMQEKVRPNYGCSGGAYTYSFTPTSLGVVIKVKNAITNDEIDLTEYDQW